MRYGTIWVAVVLSLWGLAGLGQAQYADDVWQLDLKSNTWTRLAVVSDPVAGSPTPRRHFPHAFDSSRGRMIVSGGEGESVFSDTWALELAVSGEATWTKLGAALDGPFTYRPGLYDSRRDRFVVAHAVDHLDVFNLASNTWLKSTSVNSGVFQPYQLYGDSHAVAYDSVNDRYCVVGGGPITESTNFFHNHVHILNPDTLVWSELALNPAPSPRFMAAVIYDPDLGGLTLFGGGVGGGATGTVYNDTWHLSLQNGSEQWTQVQSTTSPSARGQAAVVFDSLRKRMIVLSGLRYVAKSCSSGTYTGIDDVWVLENGVWRELATAGGRPGPRRGAGAVYDPINDRVVLFGGELVGLKAPSNLKAVVTVTGTVDLTWTDNATGEVGYVVRRWCNGAPGETIATLAPDTQSYTDTTGSCGTCGYAVQAIGDCGVTSPDAAAVVLDPCAEPLTITCPPTPELIAVDQDCQATVPDLASAATVAGGRAPITVAQTPAAGERVDQGSHEVTLTATDANGTTVTCTIAITVADLTPPAVSIATPVSWTSYPVRKAVNLSGSFVENCSVGTAGWSLTSDEDEVVVPGILNPQTATVTAVCAFTKPGVYAVELSVTDAAGNAGSVETTQRTESVQSPFVVVYDSDGFITGGGWFDSPAGSYVAEPTANGKAVLGFTAKYKKKATKPDGNVQFMLKTGRLSFHAEDLDWLVVTDQKAQLAGIGSVNGQDGYQFILTAVTTGRKQCHGRHSCHRHHGSHGSKDSVRLSIWNEAGMVYDNQLGAEPTSDAATPLTGGAIVLHK